MRANQAKWEGGWNQAFLDKCKLEENRGKYIEMDPGNARNSSSINDDIKALQQGITIPELGQRWTPPLQPGNPVIVYQQYDSPTCLFKSVSNVLLYSGDRHAAEMIDYLYSSGSVTHDFFNAINQKLRAKPHHYDIYAITGLFEGSTLRFKLNMKTDSKKNQQKQQRLKTIEANLDGYPKVGSILASDGTSGHAIGVINGWIFDSNLPHAIATTKANLDWCSSADDDATEFQKFNKCYVYIKKAKMGVSARMTKNGPVVKQYLRPPNKTLIDADTHALLMTEQNESIKKKQKNQRKNTKK